MSTFNDTYTGMINEKTLSDADIKKMITTILSKTSGNDDPTSKSINKMVTSMQGKDSLSPEQVGFLMKTMGALSGK